MAKVQIEISARHIHLTRGDFKTIFGKDELSKRNDLSEKGEFAANEVVELVGSKRSLHKVRILGPFREKTQVEISRTDAVFIGVSAPLELSGSGEGALIRIIGPKGEISKRVAMVAKRHIHMNETTAKKLKLKNEDRVSVRVPGERSVIFENVIVRMSENFTNRFHLDTDEANAADIANHSMGEIILG